MLQQTTARTFGVSAFRRHAPLFVSFVLVLIVSLPAECETYFVSPTGSASGTGTRTSPWPSVTYALSKVRGAGTTIVALPGIYRDPIVVEATDSGTASAPLIVRSEVKWGAVITGAPAHAIKTQTGANYVVFDGFDCSGAMNVGVYFKGSYNTLRNSWVHNSGSVGVGAYTLTGTLIENNLVEFNGQNPQFHHGIYADGTGIVIRNNIVRHNASLGMQLYPAISNSQIYNNLVHGHQKTGILVQRTSGGAKNIIANNTSVDNKTAIGIYQGGGDVVANNICKTPSGDPIYVEGTVSADYNLCQPSSKYQGSNGKNADPQFVDPAKQCYWLKSTSPAIRAGDRQHAPDSNFWGRQLGRGTRPDVGAFSYYKFLTLPDARVGWHGGLPYHYRDGEGTRLPDLWALPRKGGSETGNMEEEVPEPDSPGSAPYRTTPDSVCGEPAAEALRSEECSPASSASASSISGGFGNRSLPAAI